MNIICVGLGGALGSVFRYLISLIPVKGSFPFLTLITNILGAVLIGFITGTAEIKGLSPRALLFLKTGLCGGFTTFSTFSLESFQLIENGNLTLGIIYILSSILGCLFGILIGLKTAHLT